jgi:putative transposase
MAHTEGYRLTVDDNKNCVQVCISPKPYTEVTRHLCGEPGAMDDLRDAITSDDVGQAELLYCDCIH